MDDTACFRDLVKKARPAQELFEMDFNQEQVYAIVRDIARIVFRGAEKRASLTIDETAWETMSTRCSRKRAGCGLSGTTCVANR